MTNSTWRATSPFTLPDTFSSNKDKINTYHTYLGNFDRGKIAAKLFAKVSPKAASFGDYDYSISSDFTTIVIGAWHISYHNGDSYGNESWSLPLTDDLVAIIVSGLHELALKRAAREYENELLLEKERKIIAFLNSRLLDCYNAQDSV